METVGGTYHERLTEWNVFIYRLSVRQRMYDMSVRQRRRLASAGTDAAEPVVHPMADGTGMGARN